MLYIKKNLKKIIYFSLFMGLVVTPVSANRCDTQLFTATLNSELTIGDVVENLADECAFSLLVKDVEAKKKLAEKLYFVKMNNASLTEFLDTVLTENDLSYELQDSKLKISYLTTKTFKLHYLAGDRKGTSNAHVTIANSGSESGGMQGPTGQQVGGEQGSTSAGNGSKTGVSIESTDEFKFWSKIEKEIHELINRPEDSYEAPTPIINAEAGMITVTGTSKQLQRISYYIDDLDNQLKNQVLIDVKILSVTFDDSYTTGVDWNQIYSLQNMSLATGSTFQTNVASLVSANDGELSIGDMTAASGSEPKGSGAIITRGSTKINDVVKFLKTQGDVKSISNPKILTLNNQPALISVGNELFYKIQSTSLLQGGSGLGTQQTGETIDSVFAGILLDITPEIAENGAITLKINPSISDTIDTVSTTTTGS
ncbi:MAG TPA: pilus (MSHA type) biogenesis protein MshL, partial [Campylobacterales bacterium]|nr:pilus (MSHA type) biogenesis protein MshL [Campylobacterales bacterium]